MCTSLLECPWLLKKEEKKQAHKTLELSNFNEFAEKTGNLEGNWEFYARWEVLNRNMWMWRPLDLLAQQEFKDFQKFKILAMKTRRVLLPNSPSLILRRDPNFVFCLLFLLSFSYLF